MSLRDTLKGTGVALVTPFTSNQQVDFDALGNLIEYVIRGGVEYVVTMGTTGETPTLYKQEKLDIINFTYDKVGGRLPVVVGLGGNNTRELLNDLETYPLDKATAILSASPYYNKPSQEGIFQHYKALASATSKPIILYNVPGRTGSNIAAETTLRLANEVGNISGIKEASGNMIQCMHILRDRPREFMVTSGDDHLALSLIALGMDGVISVAANVFPKDFSELVRCSLKDEYKSSRTLHNKMLEGFDLMFAENNPAGIKAFLTEFGLIQNHFRLPVVPLSEHIHDKVKRYLATF
ncbi:4-hydroxy-tetrahydrodipicolinate synthase [Segetibacter sp. 3557_3]|uniref:4-hydroxy-tetrahydrodipicolinate synthase n=1 Tax=Segetibacter sp. 3557_3 TaxID=2547429 RepID=UPI0010591609|nr:4-hydroxy-tetrahydrodipicolinate synthase [Segetibacter sp. 3557_3]TDH29237.1 4-hydroxy-tetrahydrodipicolinate synthase [Segetibacter sp. 3557_3]